MTKYTIDSIAFATFITLSVASTVSARDFVSVAGSSTVLPFATIVAEQLGNNPKYKTPVVESGGSSIGKKSVCQGSGKEYIDIGNASSRMKPKELKFCNSNNVELTEIKVGYDGIVVANSKKGIPLVISKVDLGKALTAKIPQKDGTWIDNPYKKWSDINPTLPDIKIRVYGPPTTSGTRASYIEMVNQKGYCAKDEVAKAASIARNDKKGKLCRAIRTDGAYIEAGEQDNLIVKKLQEDPNTYGIFGFSYLDQNTDTLQGAVISGTEPTFDAIADGSYSISRALYIYVKHSHVNFIPGLQAYMEEWTKHWNEEGILSDSGMIPMPKKERLEMLTRIKTLPVLKVQDLK
tara:strand:+ start:716 stop:1762 length:1047 start_codon:yes stop_codon:yes gene_type:complete